MIVIDFVSEVFAFAFTLVALGTCLLVMIEKERFNERQATKFFMYVAFYGLVVGNCAAVGGPLLS